MIKIRHSTGKAQHALFLFIYILFNVIIKVISFSGRDNKDNCMKNKLPHLTLEGNFSLFFFVFKFTVHFHKIKLIK